MKRWHIVVLLGLVLLAVVYAYFHRQELGLAGNGSSGDGLNDDTSGLSVRPPRIAWQTMDRSKDGFKVEMPSDIKEIQIPAYNESGGADHVDMIFSNPASEITFSVSWAENPPVVRANGRSPDQTLDMARDSALARTQTTLVSETRITPGGFPARDIQARNAGGGVLDTRLILAGNRLFMLTAAFPNANVRREQDVIRFFNSFTPSTSRQNP